MYFKHNPLEGRDQELLPYSLNVENLALTNVFFFLPLSAFGSSLLCTGFLQLQRAGATLRCGAQASCCGGFSCCRARALGTRASVVAAHRLSTCGTWALEHVDFSSCSMWAQQLWHSGSRVHGLQQLWLVGLVAPWHVASSQTRDRTCVALIGRRILNHCATREVPNKCLKNKCISILQLSAIALNEYLILWSFHSDKIQNLF